LGGKGSWSAATDINNRGQVVGISWVGGKHEKVHVFVWDGGTMKDLGPFHINGPATLPRINGRGDVFWNQRFRGLAILWSGGVRRRLAFRVEAMNARGQIVGTRTDDVTSLPRGVLWEQGRTRDLGAFEPADINDQGEIAGTVRFDPNDVGDHAFLWRNGTLRSLGSLPGYQYSQAVEVNEAGEVLALCRRHACLWDPSGRMRDLGVVASKYRLHLNDRGQVAGTRTVLGRPRVFLWTSGSLIDIVSSRWNGSSAVALDTRGRVLASGGPTVRNLNPFVWERGVGTPLGRRGAGGYGATAMNNRGQAAGDTAVGEGSYPTLHAVLWTRRSP